MSYDLGPLKDKASLHRRIRDFFDSAGFLEAETPYLAECPIPESHIDLFRTNRVHPNGAKSPLYLLPSPELWLKALLAAGSPSVYQIGRCFRNGEQLDTWHRLEFTMLEWYALKADSESNIALTQELLQSCCETLRSGSSLPGFGTIRRMTMDDAFSEFAGFSLEIDLVDAGLAETDPNPEEFKKNQMRAAAALAGRLRERNLPFEAEESADDLFHRLFLTLVEDRLPSDRPLALTHWPILVPTLAKRMPRSPWAQRWELYIRGVEVANCYGEENDPLVLRRYWDSEASAVGGDFADSVVESAWPETIGAGLPECSGVAVGLDRLLALIRGEEGLQGLDLFPISDMIRR